MKTIDILIPVAAALLLAGQAAAQGTEAEEARREAEQTRAQAQVEKEEAQRQMREAERQLEEAAADTILQHGEGMVSSLRACNIDLLRTTVADFVDRAVQFVSQNRGVFTAIEAIAADPAAVRGQLRRLKKRGLISEPVRSFHVIVPPEYRRLGCLPAEQFIHQLMDHLGSPYYVSLLSGAERHGAAHQRPQSLQVMVPKNRRPITCGQVAVEFIARASVAQMPVVEVACPTWPPCCPNWPKRFALTSWWPPPGCLRSRGPSGSAIYWRFSDSQTWLIGWPHS